jgi:hypothetical protein
MITVDLGVIGFVFGVCLTFGGLLLSNKVTGFGASPQWLGGVSFVSVLLTIVPSYGMLFSLVGTFFMLRSISKQGIISMMIVSWIMMFVIVAVIAKIL